MESQLQNIDIYISIYFFNNVSNIAITKDCLSTLRWDFIVQMLFKLFMHAKNMFGQLVELLDIYIFWFNKKEKKKRCVDKLKFM